MPIDPYWKDAESYTTLEIAFLACGEEPLNRRQAQENTPQKVLNLYHAMWRCFIEEGKATKDGRQFSRMSFDKQNAIKLIDEFAPGQSNFLKDTDAPPLNDNERDKLLKHVGALALVLASKSNRYKKGDKPNALEIARAVQEIFDALPDDFQGKRGAGESGLRDSIGRGVNLLLKDD